MSRISSSSFKVNSNLEQLVNITNTSLAVSDSTSQGSLSTIAGAVSGSQMAVSSLELSTIAGAVSGSEMAVSSLDLTTIAGAVSGSEMAVSNSDLTALGGTVSGGRVLVTTGGSSNNGGSQANLNNASSVSSGTFSSEIDVRASNNLTIFGSTNDVSNQIEIHVSANSGSDYVKYQFGMFPDSSGNFSTTLSNVAINYIKLKYTGTATVTATLLHN
tara:strand:+ start:1720 stop:2367 length:648 start_codon:yes stop_codon:yes gene_type:complete